MKVSKAKLSILSFVKIKILSKKLLTIEYIFNYNKLKVEYQFNHEIYKIKIRRHKHVEK